MIKKYLLTMTALLSAAVMSHAGTGTFESFIGLDISGSGNQFYGCTQVGPSFLTNFNGLNIGTFVPGDSVLISGGELETFKNGGGNVTAAELNWKVNELTPLNVPGAFAGINLGFTANATFADAASNVFSNSGDQKWAQIASTPNILSGLTVGTYELEVYFKASTNEGDRFSNNGGANYKATFTVVPEPSSISMLLGSSFLGAFYFLRRKRA